MRKLIILAIIALLAIVTIEMIAQNKLIAYNDCYWEGHCSGYADCGTMDSLLNGEDCMLYCIEGGKIRARFRCGAIVP